MKAAIGKFVQTLVSPRSNGGSDVAPAVITAVTEVEGENDRVNLTVFVDGSDPLRLTNVEMLDKRPKDDEPSEDDEPERTETGELVTSPPLVKRVAFPLPR